MIVFRSLILAAFLPVVFGKQPNYWFSFGDSYTKTGFETNGTLPTEGNPLGNPPYPGHPEVGGVNWIDLDTVVYNNSLIMTYNLAYGGATIDANLVVPYLPTVLTLTDQVNDFLSKFGDRPKTTRWESENTLFSIWIGINDIGDSFYLGGDRDAFSDTLLDAEFALVKKLYNAGARNFLWINVPPVYRSPRLNQSAEWQWDLEKSVIEGFNSKLCSRIASFKEDHKGVQTYLWDSFTAFSDVLDNPTKFGFVGNSSYGSPGDFWGDNYHPSSEAHEIWGRMIGEDVLGGTIW